MDNKKRMMFLLEEDYYFITIKIITILMTMNCYRNKMVDYRKLAFIVLFIKDDSSLKLFSKSIEDYNSLSIIERERLLSIYCRGNMGSPIIERVLFFLEKKNVISMVKNEKYACVDVSLVKSLDFKSIFLGKQFEDDIERVKLVCLKYNRIRSVKYDTFIEKVFGSSEVM